jgi:hypothetical protein
MGNFLTAHQVQVRNTLVVNHCQRTVVSQILLHSFVTWPTSATCSRFTLAKHHTWMSLNYYVPWTTPACRVWIMYIFVLEKANNKCWYIPFCGSGGLVIIADQIRTPGHMHLYRRRCVMLSDTWFRTVTCSFLGAMKWMIYMWSARYEIQFDLACWEC